MNTAHPSYNMLLKGIELTAYLGWPEEERIEQQPVIIDVEIQFKSIPKACLNDSLSDTVCYDALIKLIKNVVATKTFHLLEHLTHEIYRHIKQTVSQPASIGVCVKKNPPIPELTGGALFYIRD